MIVRYLWLKEIVLTEASATNKAATSMIALIRQPTALPLNLARISKFLDDSARVEIFREYFGAPLFHDGANLDLQVLSHLLQ